MLGHRTLAPEEYLDILNRRWWIIAVPALILPILAYGLTFFLTPQYVSQTLVLVEQQTVPDNYVKPVIAADLNGRLASMKEQILSRSRLEPIIDRFHLYGNSKLVMDDRIALARKNILITPIQSDIARSGGLPGFFISFQASEARTAQLVCGEITSLFVNANLHAQEQSAQDTTDFLREQMDGAKRDLDEQDARLAQFQVKYFGKLPGQEETNLNMLASLDTQLDGINQSLSRMEQDQTYQQSLLTQQLRDLQSPTGRKPMPQAQQAELQQLLQQQADLKQRYTDNYPDVIAIDHKIQDLRAAMAKAPAAATPPAAPVPAATAAQEPDNIQQLRAQLRAQQLNITQQKHAQAKVQQQIRLYQDRIQSSPEVQEQFKELTRNYQTAQAFYDDLLSKMNQSKMATDLQQRQQGEQFRVMDQPNLPDAPIFPKRRLFVGMGLAAGIGLGLLIIALLEYADTSLHSDRDIWSFTKLPTLAIISQISGTELENDHRARATANKLKNSPVPAKPLADVKS